MRRTARSIVAVTCLAGLVLPAVPAAAQLDSTPPVVSFKTGPGPLAPIIITFDEPAGPVTPLNTLVEHSDGSAVASRRRCYAGGAQVGCTGLVRRVRIDPHDPLPLGDHLTVLVNPQAVADPVEDADGNAAATTQTVQQVRASQGEAGPGIVAQWKRVNVVGASSGSFRSASTRGMTATFRFRGDRITWLTRTGPGDGLAEVHVDGVLVRRVDLSAPEVTLKARRSYRGFGDGMHTLRIVALGRPGARGSGRFVIVDGFSDERGWFGDQRADFGWARSGWPGARNNVVTTDTKGASLTIAFAGGGLDWWQPVGPDMGRAVLILDGKRLRNTDHYAPSRGVRRRTISGLQAGVHTLVIRALNTKRGVSRGTGIGLDHVDTQAPVEMFGGLGAWIDLFDYNGSTTSSQIDAMLNDMRSHGVETLWLETARYNSSRAFDYPSRVRVWLKKAHAKGIAVVGWYFPAYSEFLDIDVARTIAIAEYRSPDGERFDATSVDIEYRSKTSGPAEFNAGITEHLRRVRAALGVTAPLASIAPPPNQMELAPSTWAGFPWPAIGRYSDAVVPMAYSSYRKANEGGQCPDRPKYCTKGYTRNAVLTVRQETGRPDIPVHVIGGIADRLSQNEVRDFVLGAEAADAFGASMYDHRTLNDAKYELLEAFDPSPLP